MASKENKGGVLKNSEVEEDNRVKGKQSDAGHYQGVQDTGDAHKRETGNDVQRRDGLPEDEASRGS